MPKRVIAIEDDPQITDLLHLLLESPELQILHCSSGREGLEAVKLHHPDLVLLDVKLPEMTGWEVLDAIRADDTLKNTPVIMLSVSQPEEAERRAMFTRSLLNFYIPKPFDLLALRRRIGAILDISHWEMSENPAKPKPKPAEAPPIFPISDKLFEVKKTENNHTGA